MADTDNSDSEDAVCYEKSVELLTKGVVKIWQPSLTFAKRQLRELTDKQEVLKEQIHKQNLQLEKVRNLRETMEVFDTIKTYQNKLSILKKDIRLLHGTSISLKIRALKLEEHTRRGGALPKEL